ncbi:MAG: hypothetical protein K9I47_06825 [Bacteroidales bacterium]|nr:hypothetical protein [Bacteroidales bacterium]
MKLKVHYTKDATGRYNAVKIDIEEWKKLKAYLEKACTKEKESLELIETPVEVQKLKPKPKSRHFSDFIMDI